MARHRAPDVASPLHGPFPPARHPTGSGRPRHAANHAARVDAPDDGGRHRALPALHFVGPLVVEVPEPPPRPALVEVRPTPVVITIAPAPAPPAAPDPGPTEAPQQSLAETVTWVGFACLVSCAVVAGGQGPRTEALWILGSSGGTLSTVGLGLLLLRRRRHRPA